MVRGYQGKKSGVAIVCVEVIVEERSLYGVVVVEETSLINKKNNGESQWGDWLGEKKNHIYMERLFFGEGLSVAKCLGVFFFLL